LIGVSEFLGWSNTAAFPQIPTREAFRVWRRMKLHPRFDDAHAAPREIARWRLRPIQGDLNATTDRWRFANDDGHGASAQSQSSTQHTTGTDS